MSETKNGHCIVLVTTFIRKIWEELEASDFWDSCFQLRYYIKEGCKLILKRYSYSYILFS